MDWRLIAAISAAGGSFCCVAVGAYVLFTANPAPQKASSPAPVLLSEFRFPAATPPSLVSAQPPAVIPLAPQSGSAPAFAPVVPGAISTSGAAPPSDSLRP